MPAKKRSVKKAQEKMTPVKKTPAKKTQVKKTLLVVPAQVPQEDVVGVSAVAQQADEPAPVVHAADVVDVAIPAVPAVEYEDVHTPEANGSPPQRPPQTELFLKSKGIVVLNGI
jgi:hypothetical protein